MKDLFSTPELIPSEIMAILNTFEDETYSECERVKLEIEQHGYTFDYYLDAQPYNLRKVKTKKPCNISNDCGAFKAVEAELLSPNGIKIGW
jgi:hypothetical protein